MRIANSSLAYEPFFSQLFVRNTEDLFLFCSCTYTPISSSCAVEDFFLLFDSPVATLRLFYCSASGSFNENLPILRLPSSKSSIHNNDSHVVRFLRSLKLCCPDAKPQCYLLCAVLLAFFSYIGHKLFHVLSIV